MGEKITTEDFISMSNNIHNNKYDYSKVNYKDKYSNVIYNGAFKKVEIICQQHNSFWQSPSSHLNGIGCPSCLRKSECQIPRAKATGLVALGRGSNSNVRRKS